MYFALAQRSVLNLNVETPRFDFVAFPPISDSSAGLAEMVARLNECRRHAEVVGGYRLAETLELLCHDTGVPATAEVTAAREKWANRSKPSNTSAWMLDVADDYLDDRLEFPDACRAAGLHSNHLDGTTVRSAVTRAAAIALCAAHESNYCTWRGPVDLDAIVATSAGETLGLSRNVTPLDGPHENGRTEETWS
ncbi:hypothetical protein [Nocardia sp. NPDC050710]|uniref:hypothetical protein n=1 Tax=Nocardia sp. NPDC050710 TaxID=3157220 RepID=UPI003408D2C0